MFRWIPYAFVRIVVFYCGGVLLAIYFPDFFHDHTSYILFGLSAVVYLILACLYSRLMINPGLVGLSTVLLSGYINVHLNNESRRDDHLINVSDSIFHYTAVITRPAEEKERTWKYEVSVLDVSTNNGWKPATGKVILYVSKLHEVPFRPGDNLLINGAPRLIPPPSNPGQFDLQKFSAYKNIFHQHFIKDHQLKWIGNKPSNRFLHYATLSRLWADSVLRAHIDGKRNQSLASALVLGVTDGLDNELLNAYSASGAMHVLSVSGLHVGIVYWLILMIFKPVQRLKHSQWTLAITSLVVLWTYAFVTGLSPSVLRAVTMFSFVALARPLNRQTNIYNTLAASAFILLVYDPNMLMSVGFQLSYLAVLGIVRFQPGLYLLWEPNSRLWDEIWKITSVSIAAQLATFSLSLFYFHQFPNYFLLANVFVIPLSFMVLLMGIGIIAVSYFGVVASVLGWLLEWIIRFMNEGVFLVERLPFSVLDNVHISALQCCILILLVMLVHAWIETKKLTPLIIASSLCILYSMDQWIHLQKDVTENKITFYNISGHTAVDLMGSGKSYFLADSVLERDTLKIRFHVSPGRLVAGVRNVMPATLLSKKFHGCSVMVWNKQTILHIQGGSFSSPRNLTVDFVIISNSSVKSMSDLLKTVKAREFIIDSSNSFRNADRLLKESVLLNINVKSLQHHGAYTTMI